MNMTYYVLIHKLRKERLTGDVILCAADAIEALMAENERLQREVDCPFKKGTIARDVLDGDWAGMSIDEIAATLHTTYSTITTILRDIKRKTGYVVPHGRKERGEA